VSTLEEKRRKRLQFMEAVYEATGGDRFTFIELGVIAPKIGLSQDDAGQVAQYLVDEHLLKWAAMGGVLEITHYGIKEVEQSRSQPSMPTVHFPPFNVIHIEHMTQSQIQQGTTGSVQQMSQAISSNDAEILRRFLAVLERQLVALHLSTDAQAELEAQIATMTGQMKSANPKRSILKDAGSAALEILMSAPGRAAAEEVLKHVPDWIR
jgi:hypothetical protein